MEAQRFADTRHGALDRDKRSNSDGAPRISKDFLGLPLKVTTVAAEACPVGRRPAVDTV
jgi:hypothetical protein